MPKLLLMKDSETISSFDLSEGKSVVGREADCDIRVDDEAISRHHFQILTVMGDAFLEDLGSRNGTYVNGKLSLKCALNDGDVIQVGNRELLFSHPEEPASTGHPQGDVDATQIIRPGDFGPATREAREKNREREGVSPVTLAAREDKQSTMRPGSSVEPEQGRGFWAWLRRLFS